MSLFDRRRPLRTLFRIFDKRYQGQDGKVQELPLTSAPAGTGGGEGELTGDSSPTSFIEDQDADTRVDVEESSDEDKIRFTTSGTERMVLAGSNLDLTHAISSRVQVEDSGNSTIVRMASTLAGASKGGVASFGTNKPLYLGTASRLGKVKLSEQHDQMTVGTDLSEGTDFGVQLCIGTGDGTRPALGIKESATTPSATSGIGKIYIKSTDSTKLYFKDEAGTETDLTAGGGGGGDPDQNLWETVSSDSGSAVANITTDTLTIAGGTGISTAVAGDTLTITNDSPASGSSTTQATTSAVSYTLSAGNTSSTDVLWTGTAESGKKMASTHFPFLFTSVGSGRATIQVKWQEHISGTTWTDITNSDYTVDTLGASVGGIASCSVADDVDTNLRLVVVGTYVSGTSLSVSLTAGVVSVLTP